MGLLVIDYVVHLRLVPSPDDSGQWLRLVEEIEQVISVSDWGSCPGTPRRHFVGVPVDRELVGFAAACVAVECPCMPVTAAE